MVYAILSMLFLCVSFWTTGVHAAIEDHFILGENEMSEGIALCRQMRTTGNEFLRIPPSLHKELTNTLNEARHLLPSRDFTSLKRDAERLIADDELTLFQYNVLLYRLTKWIDLHQYRPRATTNYLPNHILIPILRSQEETIRYLKSQNQFGDSESREFSSTAFSMMEDGEYCPVAFPKELGIIPINYAFAENVYPFGVVLKNIFFDSRYAGPLQFLEHDLGGHADLDTAMNRENADFTLGLVNTYKGRRPNLRIKKHDAEREFQRKQFKNYAERFRELHLGFFKNIKKSSDSDQERVHIIYFLFRHENSIVDFDQVCPANNQMDSLISYRYRSTAPRFEIISDLNGILPSRFHGNPEFLKTIPQNEDFKQYYEKPNPLLEGIAYGPFGEQDRVPEPLRLEIRNYLDDSLSAFCREWRAFPH